VPALFDIEQRRMRRDRAARSGGDPFLLARAFDDCLERIALVERRFERALLLGCPSPAWPERLRRIVRQIDVRDPGPLFAARAEGEVIDEDRWDPPAGSYDLVLAVGTLDTVNDLPLALRLVRQALRPDRLFIGALSGGDTLPQLRTAMRAADAVSGTAAPHVHPRIEASALAPLLVDAGFVMPVVDVDRVQASYRSLESLIGDLRGMAATNVLAARPRVLGKDAWRAARQAFGKAGTGERPTETFEIVHVAAWTPTT
jgi:SAM-dependent methyltransferase